MKRPSNKVLGFAAAAGTVAIGGAALLSRCDQNPTGNQPGLQEPIPTPVYDPTSTSQPESLIYTAERNGFQDINFGKPNGWEATDPFNPAAIVPVEFPENMVINGSYVPLVPGELEDGTVVLTPSNEYTLSSYPGFDEGILAIHFTGEGVSISYNGTPIGVAYKVQVNGWTFKNGRPYYVYVLPNI